MRASGGALVVGSLLAVFAGRAASARADRGQVTISLIPAASVIKSSGDWSWGGGGAVDLSVGITDALAIRLTGATTAHPLSARSDAATMTIRDPGGRLLAYHAGAGVTYTIDILRLVPTIDFSIGLLGSGKQSAAPGSAYAFKYDFGISAGLGLDYLIDRRWSVGAVVRYQAYLTSPGEIPAYIYFGPRVGVRFN